jgi:hypothetical protein
MIYNVNVFYYPYLFELTDAPSLSQQLTQYINSGQIPHDKKILLWAGELLNEDTLRRSAEIIRAHGLQHRTAWWLQPSHSYSAQLLSTLGSAVYRLDMDLLLLDLHLREGTISPNPQWNPNTGRFLFLTGKPYRANRIRLLWKFAQAGLDRHCDWSLFVDDRVHHAASTFIPELSPDQFQDFVDRFNRNLDTTRIFHLTNDSIHRCGYPFDGSWYTNTSFRVISETTAVSPIITDKTWITMINKVPFIMAGEMNNFRYLHDRGYKTFENYLPNFDYDNIVDLEARLDAIVENTKFWQKHINQYQRDIFDDVESNYRLLRDDMQKTVDTAKQLASYLDEPDRSIYSLIPLCYEQIRWVSFYYKIKDSRWPDCFVEESFRFLPAEIQQECIDNFGYKVDLNL